jgi:hypothetical protein
MPDCAGEAPGAYKQADAFNAIVTTTFDGQGENL